MTEEKRIIIIVIATIIIMAIGYSCAPKSRTPA